jgi:hypothetical protein
MRRSRPRDWKFDTPLSVLADETGLSLSILKKLSVAHPSVVEWLLDNEAYIGELKRALQKAHDLALRLRDTNRRTTRAKRHRRSCS